MGSEHTLQTSLFLAGISNIEAQAKQLAPFRHQLDFRCIRVCSRDFFLGGGTSGNRMDVSENKGISPKSSIFC